MATITRWVTGEFANPGFELPDGKVGFPHFEISFADLAVSAADVVRVITVPANTWVFLVVWEVTTAEGSTCTATIGDGSGAASWDAQINLNSAAASGGVHGTDTYMNTHGHGKFYSSADTIDLTMGHAASTAVFWIGAQMARVVTS